MSYNKVFEREIFGMTEEKLALEKENITAILDAEMSKAESEMNTDLIEACLDYLEDLDGTDAKTEQELEEIIEKIKASDVVYGTHKEKNGGKCGRFGKKFVKLALVATLIFLMFSVSVTGYDEFTKIMLRVNREGWLMIGKDEYIRMDSSEEYDSVEDLVSEKSLNILYPKELPEGVELNMILYKVYKGMIEIDYCFTDLSYCVGIDLDKELPDNFVSVFSEELVINGVTYYRNPDVPECAFTCYDGNYYTISAPDGDAMIKFLESMEAVK